MITWKPRSGFTIVELLIIVGVLAILLALLIPVASRARAAANNAVCQSNLRQIGSALLGYALDNNGAFPANAVFSVERANDWLFWQSDRELEKSAIAKRMGQITPKVLICPADDTSVRFRTLAEPYPYSYTFNQTFASNNPGKICRVASLKRSSEKFLVLCEDEFSADDGNFDPRPGLVNENVLSNRHAHPRDMSWKSQQALPHDQRPDRNNLGNVAFADGHAGQITRYDSWQDTNYEALMP